ncbi:hypothetical protein EV128_105298 [Rhizobium azibense]|nr:hypothetical protein EV128_105298 [Rhizobium azibense]
MVNKFLTDGCLGSLNRSCGAIRGRPVFPTRITAPFSGLGLPDRAAPRIELIGGLCSRRTSTVATSASRLRDPGLRRLSFSAAQEAVACRQAPKDGRDSDLKASQTASRLHSFPSMLHLVTFCRKTRFHHGLCSGHLPLQGQVIRSQASPSRALVLKYRNFSGCNQLKSFDQEKS